MKVVLPKVDREGIQVKWKTDDVSANYLTF